ncbi:MAG: hypothetical protein ACKVQB_13780 [Bacteroidia bacterium]
MKKIFKVLILLTAFYKAQSQGCSDAGFCTAGSIKPTSANQIDNSFGFTLGYGLGEQKTHVITPQFEPQIKVSSKSMVQAKIPFVFINGKVGSVKGFGDVVLTYNYLMDSTFKNPVTLTFGTRIATGTSALKAKNIPLPMPYQVSLGTTDLILGAKMQLKKGFSISVGCQLPMFNKNQNGFDSASFKLVREKGLENGIINDEENYFISSQLKRKADILLRVDRIFKIKSDMLSIGLLPIYHLGNDKVELNNQTIEIENSRGLTLNFNCGFYHKWGNNLELSAVFAAPLIVRESRPDGLTRAVVFVTGIRYYL